MSKGLNFKKSTRSLIKNLSGMAFLVNPSPEVVKEDYSVLISKQNIERPFETGADYFKTPKEIDEYFLASGSIKKKNVKAYLGTYKPLILSASNIFRFPFSFQSCLIFKESRFNKRAVSPVGAKGVAQFTEETYRFLGKALRIGKGSLDFQGEEMLAEAKFAFQDPNLKKLSYSKYNTQTFRDMYEMWQMYLSTNELDEINLEKVSFVKVIYKPEYSIGLSSMYLYYLKHRVKYDLRKHVKDDKLEDPDFILSLAGAYNQGARRVLKAVKRNLKRNLERNKKKPDFLEWISYQSKVSETRDYISSIRTCMKKVPRSLEERSVSRSDKPVEKKSSYN